jgi:UDP-glucose 4-epimerase
VVPDLCADPLGYYFNNTVKTRALIEAQRMGVKRVIFSSAAVYWRAAGLAGAGGDRAQPDQPYGRSKLMSEWMLQDAAKAHGFSYIALRYFNVAGADPKLRSGQSSPRATHLIKVASQAALGQRDGCVFGTDYATPDGTCVRDHPRHRPRPRPSRRARPSAAVARA